MEEVSKSKRGFASMSPERRREIASKGGKKVSQDKEHMKAIGSKGGATVSSIPGHMSKIGKIGGTAVKTKSTPQEMSEQEPSAE